MQIADQVLSNSVAATAGRLLGLPSSTYFRSAFSVLHFAFVLIGWLLLHARERAAGAMKIHAIHDWNMTPAEAVALQRQLVDRLDTETPLGDLELVAGADASYARFSRRFFAGVVVVRIADGVVIEKQGATAEIDFPYVPGLLSFREAPALLQAFAKIESNPDVVMFDGQGVAHPRGIGIAAHVGLFLGRPCLGCAKSRLFGEHNEPDVAAGSVAPLRANGEVVGAVVRTKARVKPVYVSAGHRIDLASAVRVVLASVRGYRLPEPTRQAHHFVNALRRAAT